MSRNIEILGNPKNKKLIGNLAIDFIKKHNYDIIDKNCIKNEYKEVI